MTTDLWLITYNGMRRHDVLAYAGVFLLRGSPRSLGSAIKSFELYARVKTRSRALPTQGEMKRDFRARLKTLPRVWFVRKCARFDISYVSRLGDQEDLNRKRSAAESLELFRAACHEIASAIQLAQTRLKKTDDFDWEAFAEHLNRQLSKMPATTGALTRLLKQLKDAEAKGVKARPSVVIPSARAARNKPKMIAIHHDEHHASHVGHTADGAQFFLTTPFVRAGEGSAGREFVALYIFDARGRFREARIDDLGIRARLDARHARKVFEERFAELGPVTFGRIQVQPFQVKRFGVTFGLVPEPLEDEEDEWCVEVQPGNYMAFFNPWDSGHYDT